MEAELAALKPRRPHPTADGYRRVSNMATVFQCGGVAIGFDGTTGAITTLKDLSTGALLMVMAMIMVDV